MLTPDVDQTFRAGAIRDKYAIWQTLTSDTFILQTIAVVRLEFEETPSQTDRPRPLKFSDYEFDIIDQQIKEFLQLGIVEEAAHAQQEFVSNMFSRHKRNESSRLILKFGTFEQIYAISSFLNGYDRSGHELNAVELFYGLH